MLVISDAAHRPSGYTVPDHLNTGANSSRVNGGTPISLTDNDGALASSSNGQLIENLNLFNGYLDVNHDDVTVSNCIIDAGAHPNENDPASRGPIDVNSSTFNVADRLHLVDCTIIGGHELRLKNVSMLRCQIYWQDEDSIKDYGGVKMEDCFIHHSGINDAGSINSDGLRIYSNGTHTGETYERDSSTWTSLYVNCRWFNPMIGQEADAAHTNPGWFDEGDDQLTGATGTYDSPTGSFFSGPCINIDSNVTTTGISTEDIFFDNCYFEWGNQQVRMEALTGQTVENIRFRDCGVSHDTRQVIAPATGAGTFTNIQCSGMYWLDEGNAFIHWDAALSGGRETDNPFTVDNASGASISGHAAGDPCNTAPLDYNNLLTVA